MKKILLFLIVIFYSFLSFNISFAQAQTCANPNCEYIKNCKCGIKLNTMLPFIGDCIRIGDKETFGRATSSCSEKEKEDIEARTLVLGEGENAFPILMGIFGKILVSIILVVSFLLLIVAGVLMTTSGANPNGFKQGTDMIMKVIAGLALLGASGIILKLVNPSFFG